MMRLSYVLVLALFGAVLLFGCGREERHRTNVREEKTDTQRTDEVQRVGGHDRTSGGGASGSGATSPSPIPPGDGGTGMGTPGGTPGTGTGTAPGADSGTSSGFETTPPSR